ncbi:MAG: hypothetical protein V3V33_15160 [Candidatus Lokiarchaeia archaeon]
MPNYKQLLDMSNTTLVAMGMTMINMGLNIPLVWNELANVFASSAKSMLDDTGMKIEGSDVKSITEDFASKIKEIGFCQKADIIEVSDDNIVIDLGECIFGPATTIFRGNDPNFIPPCPMMGILYSAIESKTGKKGFIEKCLWKPKENSSIFTIKLE